MSRSYPKSGYTETRKRDAMIFEKYFNTNKETKGAKTWMTLLQTREIEKNNFQVTGDIKEAKIFAAAIMAEVILPTQPQFPENVIEPIVIFSNNHLNNLNVAF
ncbi:MAG: hypothetical protein H0W89_07555 [Candidatus Levybacteria bacterium]|nr:hypothetical protein [Candidatus Levybacteria bacterium]